MHSTHARMFTCCVQGPGVNAQHHQHMFCARIDPAVDDEDGGAGLVVTEVNVEQLPMDDPRNATGNAFVAVETELSTVHAAAREIAPEKGRMWKVKNPTKVGGCG